MQDTRPPVAWPPVRTVFFRFGAFFFLLLILTLPWPQDSLPHPANWLAPLFTKWNGYTGFYILGLPATATYKLASDTPGLYIHLLHCFLLAVIGTLSWSLVDRKPRNYDKARCWLINLAAFYLAMHLFMYGWNKIFKWQFYQPEPNTLYTPLADTYPDLLYWSTMGISRSYSIFLGIAELLAAILLCLRSTRPGGALLALTIMANVVAVNFSFSISVKVYSFLLLLLAAWLCYAERRRWWHALFGSRTLINKRRMLLRLALFGAIILFTLFPYLKSGVYNDDAAPRPAFHGAYDVPVFIVNQDTLLPLTTDQFRWRRVFIHRQNYFVTQLMDDQMQDYAFRCDTVTHEWWLQDPETGEEKVFAYSQPEANGPLFISGVLGTDTITAMLQPLDWKNKPLLQSPFTWTIDP
ncbi:hypothetical protein [Terrimonas ferruginea]|uniref:hypothetical protein n=1 Tax=Terrimonas ferruginea TaxID=249 RepID=UPI0004910EDF|nr:hypothetical protein [Terrimonas ferruginea]